MGEVIDIKPAQLDIHSDIGRAFIIDATRAGEGVISDAELLEKYELDAVELQTLAADKAVGKAIRSERERRVRSGLAAKELAAKFFVQSPGILNEIQTHAESPRHRIDAVRELRATASGNDDGSPSPLGEKFSIVINLGSDVGDRIEKVFDRPKPPPVLEDDSDGNDWG